MFQSRIFNVANVSFNAIRENEILAKFCELPRPYIAHARSPLYTCSRTSHPHISVRPHSPRAVHIFLPLFLFQRSLYFQYSSIQLFVSTCLLSQEIEFFYIFHSRKTIFIICQP